MKKTRKKIAPKTQKPAEVILEIRAKAKDVQQWRIPNHALVDFSLYGFYNAADFWIALDKIRRPQRAR